MKKKFLTGLICIVIPFLSLAQLYFSHPGIRNGVPKVKSESKKTFPWPWAGGMNSCQFCEVDMNLDGIMDLLVFDRVGNRKIPYINGGQAGQIDYSYAPEYAANFPEFHDWIIMKDYNNDGKNDIFAYSYDFPGIIVYKNISQSHLEFTLEVDSFLTSFQGGGEVNILTTNVDYPAIADVDYDGDLDILTFWGLGSFVEYHQNQSMEKYGVPDSLEFIEITQCWGHFAENDESNVIYLDTCLEKKTREQNIIMAGNRSRHTGSTFLLLDLDDDADLDLLLGDVDYPNPIELINGGNSDEAFMVSQDPDFPSYNKPVRLFSMPAAAYIDIDNDGINDLLLSPFDPGLQTSENTNSIWLYKNSGQNNAPVFNFNSKNFLQDDMIDMGSGAYPVLADFDGDGLKDLFLGNFGFYMWSFYTPNMFLKSVFWSNIALFKNTGTATVPEFTKVTHDFAGLHSLHLKGLYPAFADLDGDEDVDMLVGSGNGKLIHLTNNAGPGQPMDMVISDTNYMNIDVGSYSTPQLFDINGDDLPDLVIGEEAGNINYYQNTGSLSNPDFTFVTDSLGKVDVRSPEITFTYTGYSVPCFFEGNDNTLSLLVGSEQGKIFYFTDIEGNLTGTFTESDTLYSVVGEVIMTINPGIRSGAAIYDLDGDGIDEMLVGNFSGGLNYFRGTDGPPVIGILENNSKIGFCRVFPNPVSGLLEIEFSEKQSIDNFLLEIFNIAGEKLMNQQILRPKTTVNLTGLPKGVYFINISGKNSNRSTFIKKIIKI